MPFGFRFTKPAELAEQYVTEDELIHFDEAPDLRAWIWTQWIDLIVVVVVVIIMFSAQNSRVTAVGLVGEIWLLGSLAWRFADHAYTRYVLTDHRALRVSGVLRRDYEWITWGKVTDVSVHRSVVDRWFGTATIQIQSANEMSQFKEMADVPNPGAFAETIVDMVNSAHGPVRRSGR